MVSQVFWAVAQGVGCSHPSTLPPAQEGPGSCTLQRGWFMSSQCGGALLPPKRKERICRSKEMLSSLGRGRPWAPAGKGAAGASAPS